jgi:tetratricopeptide (TPR) repeat protein
MSFPKHGRERLLVVAALLLILSFGAAAGPIAECNQVGDARRQMRGCTAYLKLPSADPKNRAVALLNRANIHARQGRYAQALVDYKSAGELDPDNALIPYNLGNAYLDNGKLDRAEGAFSQAIALDGSFALAYLNRGIAREALGDHARAGEDYRQALKLDPSISAARRRLEARR